MGFNYTEYGIIFWRIADDTDCVTVCFYYGVHF
jgi:hypothetical protein